MFKFVLDNYLTDLPDTPFSPSTGPSRATFNDGTPSNAIVAQVRIRPKDDLNWKAPDISHLCSLKLGDMNGSHSFGLGVEGVATV